MNEWLECKLGDIPDVQTGPFSSQIKNEQYITGDTPVVAIEHINHFRITDFDSPSINEKNKQRLYKYLLIEGGILSGYGIAKHNYI